MKKFKPIKTIAVDIGEPIQITCEGMEKYEIIAGEDCTHITNLNSCEIILKLDCMMNDPVGYLQSMESAEYMADCMAEIPDLIEKAVDRVLNKPIDALNHIPAIICPKCNIPKTIEGKCLCNDPTYKPKKSGFHNG